MCELLLGKTYVVAVAKTNSSISKLSIVNECVGLLLLYSCRRKGALSQSFPFCTNVSGFCYFTLVVEKVF